MSSPTVSVLMTAFNREKYIGPAIESVLTSSFADFELIITDDCSTDSTVKIANTYAAKDSRIKVFVNEKNLGDYQNRNKAASHATGRFLKYLDADDLLYPHGLEVMVRSMERFPEAGFGLSYLRIDDIEPYPRFVMPNIIFQNEYFGDSYLGVGPSASIIRRTAFIDVGGFSGKQFIGDTELWLMLSAKYPLVLLNPSLNWWRKHPEQQIKLETKSLDIAVERLKLSLLHLERNRCFFSSIEYKRALVQTKQRFSSEIISRYLRRGKFRQFYYLTRKSGIGLQDIFGGIKRLLKR